ncbi:hypothetical protein FQZ97_960180 [compost metagenome]
MHRERVVAQAQVKGRALHIEGVAVAQTVADLAIQHQHQLQAGGDDLGDMRGLGELEHAARQRDAGRHVRYVPTIGRIAHERPPAGAGRRRELRAKGRRDNVQFSSARCPGL